MKELRVWAPRAQRVEVEIEGRRIALQSMNKGYHLLQHDNPRHGQDYALWLDGEGPFPDPRSAFQPEGVHGPSRWVDHDLFEWQHRGWPQVPLQEAIIYEVHVGTFTREGTFSAAVERLSHLTELGITHIELMPVAQFPGQRAWGYDAVNLYAPHNGYGGPDGMKRLVDACHGAGLGVILDVVYNHVGPVGNHFHRFGPYFSDVYRTPWGEAVNLDGAGSDEVRRFFIDNALMWLRDYRIDGLRIDSVHSLLDTSALPFVEQLTTEVEVQGMKTGRKLLMIAESNTNNPRTVLPPQRGGAGFNTQWSDDFHHSLHALLTKEQAGYYKDFGKIEDLARVLRDGYSYAHRYSRHRQRHHGRAAGDIAGHRFVVCLQNHDQVGNRAIGERIGHLVSVAQARLGAAVTLLSPFVPMMFQGEEWLASTPFQFFTDFGTEEMRERIRKGRQKEFASFGYDPDTLPDSESEETWRISQLRWEEREEDAGRNMLDWYRSLIALRTQEFDFQAGELDPQGVAFDEEQGWLRFRRGRFHVVCNFADRVQESAMALTGKHSVRLASDDGVYCHEERLYLGPHSVAVIEEAKS